MSSGDRCVSCYPASCSINNYFLIAAAFAASVPGLRSVLSCVAVKLQTKSSDKSFFFYVMLCVLLV